MTAISPFMLPRNTVLHKYELTRSTLRHYEEKGLLSANRISNRCYYDRASIERLELILFYRSCGLTLDEIGLIVVILDTDQATDDQHAYLSAIMQKHQQSLQQKSAKLTAQLEQTKAYMAKLDTDDADLSKAHRALARKAGVSGNVIYLK